MGDSACALRLLDIAGFKPLNRYYFTVFSVLFLTRSLLLHAYIMLLIYYSLLFIHCCFFCSFLSFGLHHFPLLILLLSSLHSTLNSFRHPSLLFFSILLPHITSATSSMLSSPLFFSFFHHFSFLFSPPTVPAQTAAIVMK